MTKSLRTDDDVYCELIKYDKYRNNVSDITFEIRNVEKTNPSEQGLKPF